MATSVRQYRSLALASAVIIGTVYALSNIFRLGWIWPVIGIDFSFGFGLSLFVWWYNLSVYPRMERRFLLDKRARWRWMPRVITTLVLTVFLVELADKAGLFRREWEGFRQPELADEVKAITMVGMLLLMIALLETTDKFYRAQFENERLKLENSVAQFEALKQQINPHFLFNSLNILKTLIANRDDKAETYLIRLSEFYRSLLIYNKNEKINLGEELSALDTYLYLLNIRFEGKFQCRLEVPDVARLTQIPPFTLQMLVENGIKHNIVSADKPLVIEIFLKDNWLVVRNNLQPKRSVEASSHIGLENISRRYQILAGKAIQIEKDDRHFTVRLPLIG